LATIPWLSGCNPVTRVKWLGNVTLGKLGVIYFGDTPEAINEFSVGVRPLLRKSARNPSRETIIVVGPKRAVPLERRVVAGLDVRASLDAL
jgi:hypothetical protein